MAVVLVTGGARGIGLGIVHAFVEAGHKVMIGDLGGSHTKGVGDWNYNLSDASDIEKAVAKESSLGQVAACELNVTVAESCAAAVEHTVEHFGGLDILVNNAGVVETGPVSDFSEENWDRIFSVNTKGIFLMTKAALEHLKASDCAAIDNTASIAGKEAQANMSAYCGSKFAAIGITQSFAKEFARFDITVNALCPGIVGTAMWLDHLLPSNLRNEVDKEEGFESLMARRIPLGRPQTAEDMGEAALYLATARNVTGIALSVAGGLTP